MLDYNYTLKRADGLLVILKPAQSDSLGRSTVPCPVTARFCLFFWVRVELCGCVCVHGWSIHVAW